MTPRMKNKLSISEERRGEMNIAKRVTMLFLLAYLAGSFNVFAAPLLIGFNDEASLRAIPAPYTNAPFTFANRYQEHGVLVLARVEPPDPRLGGRGYGHYHLGYEDPSIVFCTAGGKTEIGRVQTPFQPCSEVLDPAKQPRSISPHDVNAVIQLMFDPDGNGVPDLFNLLQITVKRGVLNVGIQFANGEIGVFNNLIGPQTYGLQQAENINRVTLEAIGNIFEVDDIVIEPAP
jgi:hypothetical protein